MKTENTKELLNATRRIINAAKGEGLLDQQTSSDYLKLLEKEPRIIYSLVCKTLMQKGCYDLYRNRPETMRAIGETNLSLARFISATGVRLKGGRLVDYTRSEPILQSQVIGLIVNCKKSKIITEDEEPLFRDLVEWDETNCAFVEAEILNRVKDWSYEKFQEQDPYLLKHYIGQYYPDWYSDIIKPYEEKMKNNSKNK